MPDIGALGSALGRDEARLRPRFAAQVFGVWGLRGVAELNLDCDSPRIQ